MARGCSGTQDCKGKEKRCCLLPGSDQDRRVFLRLCDPCNHGQNGGRTVQRHRHHGDLHHENILRAERGQWLAIDPKGVLGEPAYEAGALLRNPIYSMMEWPDLAAIQSRRLDILAEELGIARRRLQDWAVAQAVLSAWWSYEDEGMEGQKWITLAESIRTA